jgi:hypothetical protein
MRKNTAVGAKLPDTAGMVALAQRFRRDARAASFPGYASLMLVAAEELETAIRDHVAMRAD